jgi:hypothetical protein
LKEINILKIEIREYEESKKTYIPKKNKNNQKKKSSDSDDFLDQEYNKYKEENKKRYQEQKVKEEREKEEKKRRREQRREQRRKQKRKEEREEQKRKEPTPREKLFQDCGIQDIPKDLSQLFDAYDKKKYRELTLKYHPDKSEYHDGYIKVLNVIKDKYNPKICKNDETWVK